MFNPHSGYSHRSPAITRHVIRSTRSPIARLLNLQPGNIYERTTVRYAHCCVTTCTPFITSTKSLYGTWLRHYEAKKNLYVVYSYGEHFPIYVYDPQKDIWYGNADTYSVTTSKHQACARPLEPKPYTDPLPSNVNNPCHIKWLTTNAIRSVIQEFHYPPSQPNPQENTAAMVTELTHINSPASHPASYPDRSPREPRYKGNFNFPKLIRQLDKLQKSLTDKNLLAEAQLVRAARTGIVHLLDTPMLVQGTELTNLTQIMHTIDWKLLAMQEKQLDTTLRNDKELTRGTALDGVTNLLAALRYAAKQDGIA